MRKIEYLSPSSYMLFQTDRENFYLDRLAAARPQRIAQTLPMSIGSAFDAYVKSHLHSCLYGEQTSGKFHFETLFEKQVEPQNRDWAREHGKHAFKLYRQSGSLADLLADLKRAQGEIRFEDTVEGTVEGVPLLGKPDLYFTNSEGHPVILDFKVNGWTGNSLTSPKPGYVRLRTCYEDISLNHPVMHKNCYPQEFKGVRINGATTLDAVAVDWATQLAIYAWLLGAEVGSDFVCAIDQLACRGGGGKAFAEVRVAEHRLLLSKSFQVNLLDGIKETWAALESGHIFTNLSRAESDAKCAQLEDRANGLAENPALAAMVRSHKNW